MNTQIILPGLETTDYHDFKQQLEYANVNTTPSKLLVFYKSVFPWLSSVEKVTDLGLQKQGIDTVVKFPSGKEIYFDEKVRSKDWGDILIEEFSVWRNYPYLNGNEIDRFEFPVGWKRFGLKPGWISGEKITDYITYIIKPSKKVYFLPFLLLQAAWCKRYREWLAIYGRKPASNKGYKTTNIPIEIDVLYRAIYEARNGQP
jgi:hypothetical protein